MLILFLLPFLCFSGHIFCIGCPGGFISFVPPQNDDVFHRMFRLQQAKTKSKHFITFFAWLFMYCYVFFIVHEDRKRVVVAVFCRVKRSWCHVFNLTLFFVSEIPFSTKPACACGVFFFFLLSQLILLRSENWHYVWDEEKMLWGFDTVKAFEIKLEGFGSCCERCWILKRGIVCRFVKER